MHIIKRDGRTENFDARKIANAIGRAFAEGSERIAPEQLDDLVQRVCAKAEAAAGDGAATAAAAAATATGAHAGDATSVEEIQDLVERTLMQAGHYDVAKRYILYRHHRSELRQVRRALAREAVAAGTSERDAAEADATAAALKDALRRIQHDFTDDAYSLTSLRGRYLSFLKEDMDTDARLAALVRAAVELTAQDAPRWEHIAGRLLAFSFSRSLAREEAARGIQSFYDKLVYLTDRDLYGDYILAGYTREELERAAGFMVPARDELFSYSGLDLLIKRYVIGTHDHVPLESVQEMFLGIALHLALREPAEVRLTWVQRFYDTLSTLKLTMATPTMSNARKPDHQLSSCFIDTVPDSLIGIYRSIDNFAQVSKYGGGMGMYLGHVRATGGQIRGFKGVAGGVIRWIRVINDTAVAVDQLGVRQGAVAVYLDAWHRDLPEFLQLRTNNGDERMKAHDVFPAVCYPDLFWRMADQDMDQDWYLMCPHDIETVRGYRLEDYFGEEWERRYRECVADPRIEKRTISIKDLVRLILKSAVETGTPFAFMRDTVNRMNPNPQAGIIYCSNLCTEICQNTSEIAEVSREVVTENGDTVVVTTTRPGDFVVCNLASLTLGRLPVEDDEAMGEVVETAVRALDNVIDLNFYALPYARLTNHRYRSIGLGVSGYHHMLAQRGVAWESEEHVQLADEVFERISYHAIAASERLAEERGSYERFAGSDWETGAFFDKRGYTGGRWDELRRRVAEHGLRNAYLIAIAPTSSTSIVSGTTPGIDPIMRKFFLEEKKGAMLPRVAPDLSPATFWYYKPAHTIDQLWSVRAAGARQRHIDQAQSMNLYITNEYTMRQVFTLYLEAWRAGVKTIYYVRSKSLEVEECESCAS